MAGIKSSATTPSTRVQSPRRLLLDVERWVRVRFHHFRDRIWCEECGAAFTVRPAVHLRHFKQIEHDPDCNTGFLVEVMKASKRSFLRKAA